ncbi:parvulin-like peptidyl-prolyl cis-trans isomerase protein [Arcticibacter pallidicorallinus]|uniref:Parvulin-like peptidyl-prolyl cis-trans isomerase protein n=1 Tax=Arcticibacter pallidicorallinus TaxID=1259464 RepID=A0A2T0U8U6_9SPHI|nr:peptidylprolyl isomerase [Arcticibacter pallidicorallinus]PRY54302.1 parvulin-like peptidyl-prolyl cis-trans isomerase protein [Arcticibacter pallidicorallinus]
METRLRQELLKKYYDRIQQQSQLNIEQEILSATFSRINSSKSLSTLEKKEFSDLLKKVIASYRLPNEHKQLVLVEDFITYYNSLPVRAPLKNPTNIQHCLSTIAYSPFTKADAEKFGLNKDPKFILDKKNFKDQLVYTKYEKELLADTLPVSIAEVAHSYDSIKMKMIKPTHVRYSLFAFRNREDAMSGKIKLQFSGDNDKSVLKGLITSKRHQKVQFDSKAFPDTLKRLLFSMKAGQISFPVAVNNDIIIMLKEEESGSRLPDLIEVKPFVIREIKKRKMLLKKKEELLKLTKIYPKEDRINYSLL